MLRFDIEKERQQLKVKVTELSESVSQIHSSKSDVSQPKDRVAKMAYSCPDHADKVPEVNSSSDEDEEKEETETCYRSSEIEDMRANTMRWTAKARSQHITRLPPFTGKEPWKVWYNRFSAVADIKGWDERECLAELLPKLQEEAGEFVFGQLPKAATQSVKTLVSELSNRYRVVETKQSYSIKLSRRDQKPNESVEVYAAELKKLYDKAHSQQDSKTRQEDLLRRFLDGLIDEEASFQVEYVKSPKKIDEAVYEIVNFREKKSYSKQKFGEDRASKRPARAVSRLTEDNLDPDDNENSGTSTTCARIARNNGGERKSPDAEKSNHIRAANTSSPNNSSAEKITLQQLADKLDALANNNQSYINKNRIQIPILEIILEIIEA